MIIRAMEKKQVEERDKEPRGLGKEVGVLKRFVSKGRPEKVIFEQRPIRSER